MTSRRCDAMRICTSAVSAAMMVLAFTGNGEDDRQSFDTTDWKARIIAWVEPLGIRSKSLAEPWYPNSGNVVKGTEAQEIIAQAPVFLPDAIAVFQEDLGRAACLYPLITEAIRVTEVLLIDCNERPRVPYQMICRESDDSERPFTFPGEEARTSADSFQAVSQWWHNIPEHIEQCRKLTRIFPCGQEDAMDAYSVGDVQDEIARLRLYGVCALPALIERLQDGPCTALKTQVLLLIDGLHGHTWDSRYDMSFANAARSAEELYPSTDGVIRAVRDWWGERRIYYDTLPDLQRSIDTAVANMP